MSWFEGKSNETAPDRRYGGTLFSLDEKRVLVFGGRGFTEFYGDCWLLMTETIGWIPIKLLGDIPPPSSFSCGATTDSSQIFLFGGSTAESPGSNSMFVADATNLQSMSPAKNLEFKEIPRTSFLSLSSLTQLLLSLCRPSFICSLPFRLLISIYGEVVARPSLFSLVSTCSPTIVLTFCFSYRRQRVPSASFGRDIECSG